MLTLGVLFMLLLVIVFAATGSFVFLLLDYRQQTRPAVYHIRRSDGVTYAIRRQRGAHA